MTPTNPPQTPASRMRPPHAAASRSPSKPNIFFHVLVAYALMVLFVIPYETQLPHARVMLPVLTLVLILQLIHYRSQILITDVLATCLILFTSFFKFSTTVLFRHTLPICFVLIAFSETKKITLNRWFISIACWISTLSIIYQLSVYRNIQFDGSTRITLSNGDPNVSGLFMLLFFFFCFKCRFMPGIIVALASTMLLLSRNYMLALLIFGFIYFFENWAAKIASKLNFSFIFIAANAFGIWIGEYYINHVEVGLGYDTGATRLLSFNDRSNLIRFEANRLLLRSYWEDFDLAAIGFRDTYEAVFRPLGAIIHNSFLEVLAYIGVPLTILYFFVLLKTISGYYNKENYKFIFSHLFFCLFLHSALQGVSCLLFIAILALPTLPRPPQKLPKRSPRLPQLPIRAPETAALLDPPA